MTSAVLAAALAVLPGRFDAMPARYDSPHSVEMDPGIVALIMYVACAAMVIAYVEAQR